MAARTSGLFLLLVVATVAARAENNSAFQALSTCYSVCRDTFPPHTYEQSSHVQSCHRGCRFYTLAGYSVRGPQDLKSAEEECSASCKEAYADEGNQSACVTGCAGQEPTAKQRLQQFEEFEQEEEVGQLAMSSLSLSSLMNNVIFPMMGSLDFFMPSSVGVDQQMSLDYSDDGVGVVVIISSDRLPGFVQTGSDSRVQSVETVPADSNEVDAARSWSSFLDGNEWLSNGDLHGWSQLLLSFLLLLSIIGMLWMCCSTVATSKKSANHRELRLKELVHLQELLAYQHPQIIVDPLELPKKTAI